MAWQLKIPFLNQAEDYALGFEVGVLYALMLTQRKAIIKGIYHRKNDEQIFLTARACGYVYEWNNVDQDFFEAVFVRSVGRGSSSDARNP